MRSKIIFTILAITVLSSMIFTCSPGSFAIQSSPILSLPGSTIANDNQTRLEPIASQEYWGSARSDKFHHPSCRWAQKISPGNLVVFHSRQEALNAGYVPCKVCRP